MTSKKPQTISHLLNHPKGDVQALLDQLKRIEAINQCLPNLLGSALSQHCRISNIRKNILVLAVDSPAWANKLRFKLPQLLDQFRQQGFINLVNIEMIIQPK
ncbi:MAG: DUF721 domain-containing protein [Enterobacterales bacterium]|nr:DUF721 domain-containing protein [Enterobacterales bacterium]